MDSDEDNMFKTDRGAFNMPVKSETHDINELYSIVDDGYTSEQELDTRKLVTQMNRKKRSGGFQSMGLTRNVFNGVMKKGYKVPTPIQRKCIPLLMEGSDVVAMARTGSGKTAAFLIPMLEKLQNRQNAIGARALVLSPTRELALQTFKFTKELGRFTDLRIACILGGDRMEDQFSALHENPDILIATPGRLTHVLVEMELKLKAIQYVVFDEADRLFELGFHEQLFEILRRLPSDRQTMLFSATLPRQLIEFAKAGLNDPTLVRLDLESKLSQQLKLAFFHVSTQDKLPILIHILRNICKENSQTIIFVPTKHHVEYLTEVLTSTGYKCSYSYGSLDQVARRMNIDQFRKKDTTLLIVTDVAARGLDIPVLDNVINFTFPSKSKLFVHRVGRVARAGRTGNAFSLVNSGELAYVVDLYLFLGRPLNFVQPNKDYNKWDDVYGKVSQVAVEDEHSSLQTFINKPELETLRTASDNAYKQYLRSRPSASTESISRSKEILKTIEIGVHPLFEKTLDNSDKLRLELLESVKNYKPNATIFEIGVTKKSTGAAVVRKNRLKNEKFVTKYKANLNKKKLEAVEKYQKASSRPLSKSENVTDAELQQTFQTIVNSSSSKKEKKLKMKDSNSFKDEQFYINYRPKDDHSEAGLSITGKNFSKEAVDVSLDILGDEDVELRRQKGHKKVWDRKRKKFVGAEALDKSLGKKKIRTESGAVIPASYKSNKYDEWRKKSKLDEVVADNQQTDGISRTWRVGFRNKLAGRPNVMKGSGGKKAKRELKHPRDILKHRKLREKNLLRHQRGKERRQKKPDKPAKKNRR